MKKLLIIPFLLFSLTTTMAACSSDDISAPETGDSTVFGTLDNPSGSKTLVVYFSAEGHTKAVAERIVALTGADIYRIAAADPYAENPYDDSDRIQNEAYKDLRPGVVDLPVAETIAAYDTIFVGSPIWWHQPAMVVCTFLEAYDWKDKIIIPFFTYGATSYLNESMQNTYRGIYNVFIFNVGMHPGASEMPADGMQISGCTKVQPYKAVEFQSGKIAE